MLAQVWRSNAKLAFGRRHLLQCPCSLGSPAERWNKTSLHALMTTTRRPAGRGGEPRLIQLVPRGRGGCE
eukprot:7963811-Alexandrium_andersonii.AAC.1